MSMNKQKKPFDSQYSWSLAYKQVDSTAMFLTAYPWYGDDFR